MPCRNFWINLKRPILNRIIKILLIGVFLFDNNLNILLDILRTLECGRSAMTKTEIKWALPGEEKLLVESEIPNSALYALFDTLLKAIDNGLLDLNINRYLNGEAAYWYFPDWLRADNFSKSRYYNFELDELKYDHPEFIVSGICFLHIESKRAPLISRLFFGKDRTVSLRAVISMEKLNACADLEVVYEQYRDGSVKTISGFSDLKDLYIKLKERFLMLRDKKEKDLQREKNKRLEMIREQILAASEYRSQESPILEDCRGEYGFACGRCKECRRLGIFKERR